MREIKFRAWDQQDNVMTICRNLNDWIEAYAQAEYDARSNMSYIFKRFIWMQFTGLKDKNGKEIYEGDIMKHPIEKRWFPWVIEFHGASFCLVNIGIDGYKHEPMYLTEDRISEREVIGNIYENPELLTPNEI